MALEARLTNRMEQGLALLPKMLQSIEVLQLTSAGLLELIDRELAQNETLVAEPARREDVDAVEASDPAEAPEDRSEPETWSIRAPSSSEDNKSAFLHNVPDSGETLAEHVLGQLSFCDLSEQVLSGVASLAEHLDDRGLLAADDSELLGAIDGFDASILDQCIDVLQTLEPRGIGARDPIEAMLLQLPDNDPDLSDINAMLTRFLDPISRNKLPEVAKALGRSIDEVSALIERIKHLDPRPGAGFQERGDWEAIYPDVTVRLVGDQIEIEIDDMVLPDLGVQDQYVEMVSDASTESEVKRYLRDKLRSARELIHAVEQRKRTLARVTLAVMRDQLDFLRQGPLATRSLCMRAIAEKLDIHPSTVSRAIAGKFVQTDHGIFALRAFFDGDRRSSTPSGTGKGRMAIKDHIRDLIRNEDSAQPLSDDEIVEQLLPRNIKVARRTVAKYRQELGLPSSWRRRKFEDCT